MRDLEMEKLHLARADRHLAAAEYRIGLQEMLVGQLKAQGRMDDEALSTLQHFHSVADTMRSYRERVAASLSQAEGALRSGG